MKSVLDSLKQPSENSYYEIAGDTAMPLKREWAKFAGSWGKRPYNYRTMSPRSTNWSSLRGKPYILNNLKFF